MCFVPNLDRKLKQNARNKIYAIVKKLFPKQIDFPFLFTYVRKKFSLNVERTNKTRLESLFVHAFKCNIEKK